MLYVTTRNASDVRTAHHALTNERDAEHGLYVPFRLPQFSPAELEVLQKKSFSENVCFLLKHLLGVELKPWDLDYEIGRNPVRLVHLSHKIIAGETWRNLDWEFQRLVKALAAIVSGKDLKNVSVTGWTQIAIRISVVFGLFALAAQKELLTKDGITDVAMNEGDLSFAVSVLYCRKIGLPIGSIICSCAEDSPLWELYHTGQLSAERFSKAESGHMERLIYELLGGECTMQYVRCLRQRMVFQLTQQQKQILRNTISAVVVSHSRTESIIPSVYRTGGYILAPDSALAYGALLDHRSRSKERRSALLLTEHSPFCQLLSVAKCMNMSEEVLKERIFSM